jgi:hypothetical protein
MTKKARTPYRRRDKKLQKKWVIPDLAIPDLAIPDLAIPDLAIPDLAIPDLAIPDLEGRPFRSGCWTLLDVLQSVGGGFAGPLVGR